MSTTNIFKQFNGSIANLVNIPAVSGVLALVARVLASAIFITAGYGKLGAGYAGTQAYMASDGRARRAASSGDRAGTGRRDSRCCSASRPVWWHSCWPGSASSPALIFHTGADQMQQIMLMKNFAMAGGLLAFTVFGAGRLSLDGETRSLSQTALN